MNGQIIAVSDGGFSTGIPKRLTTGKPDASAYAVTLSSGAIKSVPIEGVELVNVTV